MGDGLDKIYAAKEVADILNDFLNNHIAPGDRHKIYIYSERLAKQIIIPLWLEKITMEQAEWMWKKMIS